jgi:hypothetical protein
MDETTAFDLENPESHELDLEVASFREQFDGRSLLDQVVRQGAQQMLQKAVEAEVQVFLQERQDRRDDHWWDRWQWTFAPTSTASAALFIFCLQASPRFGPNP